MLTAYSKVFKTYFLLNAPLRYVFYLDFTFHVYFVIKKLYIFIYFVNFFYIL